MPRASRLAPGEQRQSFQTDHRVAAPVGKPMIAGNDRVRARGAFFFVRVNGSYNKLIGRQD